MADTYQPMSRRPIANFFRGTAHLAVRICVRYSIHPDVISYLSIAASAAAAACFWQSARCPWLLLFAPLFCHVRLWFNMLDGMVAVASGKAGLRGEIINDLPDRVSDMLIFSAVAQSGLCAPISGYWAAMFALLTAYVGMSGQAVGTRREYSGIMSKPWRMVTLHIGAWATFASIEFRAGNISGAIHWGPPTILDWTCIVVIVGCLQTIIIRLKHIFAALAAKQAQT